MTNKVKITQQGNKVIIECESEGRLCDVIEDMYKGLMASDNRRQRHD